MSISGHFATFNLASDDPLWVEVTSIYGLLNLFYNPVAWLAPRQKQGKPTLELPYVITIEPHGGKGVINDDEVLVQGIDGTNLITVRVGAEAGAQLFSKLENSLEVEAFELAVIGAAGKEATADFSKQVVPALHRVVTRGSTPQDGPGLYKRYVASQAGKKLLTTEVVSGGGKSNVIYIHFEIWTQPATSQLTRPQLLAERQVEVALFQLFVASNPDFLAAVLNTAVVSESQTVGMKPDGTFGPVTGGTMVKKPSFRPDIGGIRPMYVGKDLGPTSAAPSEATQGDEMPLDSACEILVGVQQPDGEIIYMWQVVSKPY